MAAKEKDGDWNLQVSFKTEDDSLVNIRANSGAEFDSILEAFESRIDKVKAIATRLGRPPARSFGGGRPPYKPAGGSPAPAGPAPVKVPVTGATKVTDTMSVKTVTVAKVWPKKDTGRTGKFGPIYKPGTVVTTDGEKFDTFDDEVIEKANGLVNQKANIMFEVDQKYGSNKIADKGLSAFGVVEDEVGY